MNSNIILQIINCFGLISSEVIFGERNYFPDYGYPSFQPIKDIRQKFIKNRKQNDETVKRIQLLDKYLPNNTVYVDDIAHYEIDKKQSQFKKANEIETEFRNLIAMRGLKYTYKRDTFWRTWRKVHYPANDSVICYRCENTVNFTNCQYGGYWVRREPRVCVKRDSRGSERDEGVAVSNWNSLEILLSCHSSSLKRL